MKRLPVCILMLLSVLFFLNADYSYKICVYPYNEDIGSFISLYFPTLEYDSGVASYINGRQFEASRKSLGEKLHSALISGTESQAQEARSNFEKATPEYISETPFNVSVTKSSVQYDLNSLLSGQQEFLDMVCEAQDCHLLVIPVTKNFEDLYSHTLYIYNAVTGEFRQSIKVVSQFSDHFETQSLLPICSVLTKQKMGLIHLENLKTGASVSIDSVAAAIIDDCIMVPVGSHVITISSFGYKTRTLAVDVEEDGAYSINGELEEIIYSNLNITTSPDVADIYINEQYKGKSPLKIDTYVLPLAIRAEKDGYTQAFSSLSKESESVNIMLRPAWMDNSELYTKARKNFYGDFARSLIIFGSSIALQAIIPDTSGNLARGVKIAGSGLLAISLVDMFRTMFEYYRFTQYTSP